MTVPPPNPAPGLQGGCTCGAARYRRASAPIFVNCCHCRRCQRETGCAFAVNAMIERDRVELLRGDVETVASNETPGR